MVDVVRKIISLLPKYTFIKLLLKQPALLSTEDLLLSIAII